MGKIEVVPVPPIPRRATGLPAEHRDSSQAMAYSISCNMIYETISTDFFNIQ